MQKPTPSDVTSFTGKEALFSADEYLLPYIKDDPLLRVYIHMTVSPLWWFDKFLSEFQPDDDWSDSDEEEQSASKDVSTDLPSAVRRIRALEKKLADAKQDLADYRTFVGEQFNRSLLTDVTDDSSSSLTPARDDDSHYFESYGDNGKPFALIFLQEFQRDRIRYPCNHDTR